jgi:hypothetical protein
MVVDMIALVIGLLTNEAIAGNEAAVVPAYCPSNRERRPRIRAALSRLGSRRFQLGVRQCVEDLVVLAEIDQGRRPVLSKKARITLAPRI